MCPVLNHLVIDNRYDKVVIFDLSNNEVSFENSLDECEMYTGNFVSFYSSSAIRICKVLNGSSKEYAYDLVDNSYMDLQSAFTVADEKSYFVRKKNASKQFTVFGYGKNSPSLEWEFSDFREYEARLESVHEIFGGVDGLL